MDIVVQPLNTVQPMVDSHSIPVARAVGEVDQVGIVRELVHVGLGKSDVDISDQAFPFFLEFCPGRAEEVVGLMWARTPVRRVDGAELEFFPFIMNHVAGSR